MDGTTAVANAAIATEQEQAEEDGTLEVVGSGLNADLSLCWQPCGHAQRDQEVHPTMCSKVDIWEYMLTSINIYLRGLILATGIVPAIARHVIP